MIKYIMIYVTKSPKETQELAGFLLGKFSKIISKKALVVALEGELGAGKTTLVQGLAKALKIKAKIKSPTFTLIKNYPITNYELRIRKVIRNPQSAIRKFNNLYHLDCYRLRDHKDLEILCSKEILNDPRNIVLIEWSDRVKKILPKKHIKIHIDHIDKNVRKIEVKS
ncbi:MAG: tRNA (adenosine(37)-N6)-threonylcarbamoyltransferase complex ATPase subunit type 1 TsaE [Candidatus Yanofskybacteria bacterium]|nr:tRNA (adenosine(37)-N6)-threonylcarbamoyltransferase complex ATPase subunit type 1 TsaE [Candidatus Yanofskybacteria bacterium]